MGVIAWIFHQIWKLWPCWLSGFLSCAYFFINFFLGGKMEKKVNLGPETVLDASIKEGNIRLEAAYKGSDLSAGGFVEASPEQFCNALSKLIPGDSAAEQAALAIVKGALELAAKAA
jgi:hypothetical protein